MNVLTKLFKLYPATSQNVDITDYVRQRFRIDNLEQLRQCIRGIDMSPYLSDRDADINTCPAVENPVCAQCRQLTEKLIQVHQSGEFDTDEKMKAVLVSVCLENFLGTPIVCEGSIAVYFVISILFLLSFCTA